MSRALRLLAAALAAVLLEGQAAPGAAADSLEHARALLKSAILIDGHNDLPWVIRANKDAPGDVDAYDLRGKVSGQTDLKRLREGGLGAQFWSVYTPGEAKGGFAKTQLEQIDIAWRMVDRYREAFRRAYTVADIRQAKKEGRVASMLGIEGGHAIENSLGVLRTYYDLGVRYMTLTHNVNTDWADSAADAPVHHGLTRFGEQVVLEMNRLGMLVDLSHTSVETMDDALRVSKAPAIWSHSNSKAVCNVPRNVPDDILKGLPANGGVVMVSFVAGFADPEVARVMQPALDERNRRAKKAISENELSALFEEFRKLKLPPSTIASVADNIEHIRDVAGVDHVGIGSDFDGNDKWPHGLADVSMYPNLFAELIRRKWSDDDLRKLAGENLLRVMARAEAVAAGLQQTTPASTARIDEQ